MDDPGLKRDPVEELAEEFLQRRRSGDQPSVEEYAQQHPQWARRIHELFPALLLMEDLKPDSQAPPEAPAPSPPEPAIRQLGDYRIVREIGRGGMGVVYEAEQQSLSRRVAVKVLPGVYLSSPKSLKRFRREARAAARLHHTNIVPVFGVGQQDGIHYYVMQYIEGQGLDEVLTELNLRRSTPTGGAGGEPTEPEDAGRRTGDHSAAEVAQTLFWGRFAQTAGCTEGAGAAGPAPAEPDSSEPSNSTPAPAPGESDQTSSASRTAPRDRRPAELSPRAGDHHYWQSVAGIGVQVAAALDYAHHQGTLHRDIKPGNLLLDTRGTVWIADFGLAKLADQDDLTRSGDAVGTLRYMAPEQFEGQSDARSDVYSLGLTLYELITLRPAFDEKDRGRLIHQVTRQEPPAPRKLNRAVPRDLDTVVAKAIARDPGHRYQSAGDLAEDLQRFLEDRPVLARRTSPVGRLWRWCRRNRAVAALAGLALALLVAVAAIGTTGYIRTSAALRRESIERAGAETARQQADTQRQQTEAEYGRAEANLRLAMQAFEEVFDKIATAPVIQPLERLGDPTDQENGTQENGSQEGATQEEDAWQELGTASVVTEKEAAVLQSMLKFYDRFAQQNRGNVNLQEETARAYRRVGEIHQRLGNDEAAEKAYQQALATYRGLGDGAGQSAYAPEAAAIHNKLGTVYRNTHRYFEARQAHVRARDLLLAQPAEAAAQRACRLELARTYNLLAAGMPGRGPWRGRSGRPGRPSSKPGSFPGLAAEAPANHKKALDILKTLVEEAPKNPTYQLDLARTYRDLSVAAGGHRSEEAGQARQEAVRILQKLVADYPANPDYSFELAETYAVLGRRHFRGPGKPPQGGSNKLDEAIRIEAKLVERYPNVPQYQAALARLYVEQSHVQQATGRPDDAEKSLRQAVALRRALAERFADAPQYQGELARDLFMLAYVYRKRGRTADARDAQEQAIRALEALPQTGPGGGFARMMLARAYQSLAELLKQLGETAPAAEAARKAEQLGIKAGTPSRGPFRFDRSRRPPHGRPKRDHQGAPSVPRGP